MLTGPTQASAGVRNTPTYAQKYAQMQGHITVLHGSAHFGVFRALVSSSCSAISLCSMYWFIGQWPPSWQCWHVTNFQYLRLIWYECRTFWSNISKLSKHEITSNTSMKITATDVPFFYFLGKAKFSFYSNDTLIVGTQSEHSARADSKASASSDGDDVHLDYKEFPFGEQRINLLNFNYDTSTGRAKDPVIEISKDSSSTFTCVECYMYGGRMISFHRGHMWLLLS
jgi:hypothetical protein